MYVYLKELIYSFDIIFDLQNYDMICLFIINFQRPVRKPQFEGVRTAVRLRRSKSTW